MAYKREYNIKNLAVKASDFADLAMEYDDRNTGQIVADLGKALNKAIDELKQLKGNSEFAKKEPNDYKEILKLRPQGVRKMEGKLPENFKSRLSGAVAGRMAGCILGAIVEAFPVQYMKSWAKKHGDNFPPTDFWSDAPGDPSILRYFTTPCIDYTRTMLDRVPVDDDTIYTLLGLLILEDYGINFTTDDVGKAWIKYLPYACTAEEIALNNLKKGISAKEAGEQDNQYAQWIGADIRSDAWGYVCPGNPEKAAKLAYNDGLLSHRRNGIYAEMYFSAVIAAAFYSSNAIDALRIGLQEIPKDCWIAREITWALSVKDDVKTYEKARALIDERYQGMHPAHAVNNACLTVFGLNIGGDDYTKAIGETVAMGVDNDCTAATVGSIFGAVYGIEKIPSHWIKPFNNTIDSYLIGHKNFKMDDVINRFFNIAIKQK